MTWNRTEDERIGMAEAWTEGDSAEHPAPRQLARYHLRELPERQAEQVRDHLVLCPSCADLVLDLGALETSAEPFEASGTEDWSRRRSAVFQALQEAWRSTSGAAPVWGRPSRSLPGPLLRMAALIVLGGALGFVLASSWQTRDAPSLHRPPGPETLAAPQLVVPAVDLFPPGFNRGDPGSAVVRLPPEAEVYVVTLHPVEAGRFLDYRLRILDRDGRQLWAGDGLGETASGSFAIVLPAGLLPDGRYQLEVLGLGSEGPGERLELFDLEVRHD